MGNVCVFPALFFQRLSIGKSLTALFLCVCKLMKDFENGKEESIDLVQVPEFLHLGYFLPL